MSEVARYDRVVHFAEFLEVFADGSGDGLLGEHVQGPGYTRKETDTIVMGNASDLLEEHLFFAAEWGCECSKGHLAFSQQSYRSFNVESLQLLNGAIRNEGFDLCIKTEHTGRCMKLLTAKVSQKRRSLSRSS